MTADARLAINASIVGGNPTGLGIYSINDVSRGGPVTLVKGVP